MLASGRRTIRAAPLSTPSAAACPQMGETEFLVEVVEGSRLFTAPDAQAFEGFLPADVRTSRSATRVRLVSCGSRGIGRAHLPNQR